MLNSRFFILTIFLSLSLLNGNQLKARPLSFAQAYYDDIESRFPGILDEADQDKDLDRLITKYRDQFCDCLITHSNLATIGLGYYISLERKRLYSPQSGISRELLEDLEKRVYTHIASAQDEDFQYSFRLLLELKLIRGKSYLKEETKGFINKVKIYLSQYEQFSYSEIPIAEVEIAALYLLRYAKYFPVKDFPKEIYNIILENYYYSAMSEVGRLLLAEMYQQGVALEQNIYEANKIFHHVLLMKTVFLAANTLDFDAQLSRDNELNNLIPTFADFSLFEYKNF